MKLSALGTFVHRAKLADIQPVIRDTVTLFGAGRCLWGSNFPIEKLWTSYPKLLSAYRAALEPYAPADQRQILHDTAARVYSIAD